VFTTYYILCQYLILNTKLTLKKIIYTKLESLKSRIKKALRNLVKLIKTVHDMSLILTCLLTASEKPIKSTSRIKTYQINFINYFPNFHQCIILSFISKLITNAFLYHFIHNFCTCFILSFTVNIKLNYRSYRHILCLVIEVEIRNLL